MEIRIEELEQKAMEIRELVIKILVAAGSGHAGGPLGSADFWSALYFGDLINLDPRDPWNENRDRVVLSAGHYAPVQYACLAEAGFFPKDELFTLRQLGSRLQGHPVYRCLPGIENTSGPLGQGISQAVGMALASRMDGRKNRVICFMGDGEQDEGQCWEAYMLAGRERLHNLTIVIDRNNMQIDGHTEEVMPLEPLRAKLEAFNLRVVEVNGHNIEEIVEAINGTKVAFEKPSVIILHTIPGKGVEFMENDPAWHGKAPSVQEGDDAVAELEQTQQTP